MKEYKLIKLKPQRVKGHVDRWMFGRNAGYFRDWQRAIDQTHWKTIATRRDDILEGPGAIGS